MGRAKVVIDSKFPDAVFYEILGSKWPHFSPPVLRDTKFDRAENFFTDTRHYLGWVRFLVSLYLLSFEQKSQNTGHTLKNACFFPTTNFGKAVEI